MISKKSLNTIRDTINGKKKPTKHDNRIGKVKCGDDLVLLLGDNEKPLCSVCPRKKSCSLYQPDSVCAILNELLEIEDRDTHRVIGKAPQALGDIAEKYLQASSDSEALDVLSQYQLASLYLLRLEGCTFEATDVKRASKPIETTVNRQERLERLGLPIGKSKDHKYSGRVLFRHRREG